jgi:hypothetical protein
MMKIVSKYWIRDEECGTLYRVYYEGVKLPGGGEIAKTELKFYPNFKGLWMFHVAREKGCRVI